MKKKLIHIACITLLFNITIPDLAEAKARACTFKPMCSDVKKTCYKGASTRTDRGWSLTCYTNLNIEGPFEGPIRKGKKKIWKTKQADRVGKACKAFFSHKKKVTGPFGKVRWRKYYKYKIVDTPRGQTAKLKCEQKTEKVPGAHYTPSVSADVLRPMSAIGLDDSNAPLYDLLD